MLILCAIHYRKLAMWAVLCSLMLGTTTLAGEPSLVFYAPFDNSIEPAVASSHTTTRYASEESSPTFGDGIEGQAMLSGKIGQCGVYEKIDNIPDDQWTMTFWVKGLEGAQWNVATSGFQQFFQLWGKSGWSRFYRYKDQSLLMFLTLDAKTDLYPRVNLPQHDEQQWHFWAVTWEKGHGINIYLDGQRVVQDKGYVPVQGITTLKIGQLFGHDRENKLIDEFKVYDGVFRDGDILQRYWLEGKIHTQPYAVVKPTPNPIQIDGHFDTDEWQAATKLSGLIDTEKITGASTQSRILMTYDQDYLYIGMISPLPLAARNTPETQLLHGILKSTCIIHDANVDFDDHLAIQIVPNYPDGDYYRLHVNGIQTTYEYSTLKAGGVNLGWNPQWQIQSALTSDGWMLETAIPIKSFGVDRIDDGDIWGMNFQRVWKLLQQTTDTWAYGDRSQAIGQPHWASDLAQIKFTNDHSPIIKIDRFDGIDLGNLDVQISITNPSSQEQMVNVQLQLDQNLIEQTQITLAPGQTEKFVHTSSLSALPSGLITLVIQQDASDQPVFRHEVPYILADKLEIDAKSYPSSQLLVLHWYLRSYGISLDNLGLFAEIVPKGQNTPALTQTLSPVPSMTGQVEIDTSSLAEGEYMVHVQIVDSDQNIIAKRSIDYAKRPMPSWIGNQYGISDTPPPPWSPVEVDTEMDSIRVWGRQYIYDGQLLPEKITTRDQNILARPIELIVVDENGIRSSSAEQKNTAVTWQETTAIKAQSVRSQNLGKLRCESTSYVEYDGMIWIDLTITPTKQDVKLRSLSLQVPLKSQWASLINTYDYGLRTTGTLPADGWEGGLRPLWLGNGDGGIQFFAETDAMWIGSKQIRVRRSGQDQVILDIPLVNQAFTLKESRTFSFGLIATPVKPPAKNHRDWRIMSPPLNPLVQGTGTHGQYLRKVVKENPNIQLYHLWTQGWWLKPPYTINPDSTGFVPVLARDQFKAIFPTDYGLDIFLGPYGRLQEMGTANPWFKQFGDEWSHDINITYIPDPTLQPIRLATRVSQASESLQDFYAWGYHEFLSNNDVRALYFDVSKPLFDNNVYHGAGVQLDNDLPPSPTYNILGTRRTLQRIYTILKENNPDAKLFYHMSGQLLMATQSFCDGMIDGENGHSLLDRKDNRGYEKVLTIDKFLAEYAGQNNLGPVGVFLPQFTRAGSIRHDEWAQMGYAHAEYVMGLVLLHDSAVYWAWMPAELISNVYRTLDASGVNGEYDFVPYWRQDAVVLPDGVHASFYLAPDKKKIIAVVMNVSGKDQQLDLRLDASKLGFNNRISGCIPLYPDTPIHDKEQVIRNLEIPDNNFRLLEFSF